MYVGLVKYELYNDDRDESFRIGHHPTSNLDRILDWKKKTEQLDHVIECQVYKIINPEDQNV